MGDHADERRAELRRLRRMERELSLSVACSDCGAAVGWECKPDFGCSRERRAREALGELQIRILT